MTDSGILPIDVAILLVGVGLALLIAGLSVWTERGRRGEREWRQRADARQTELLEQQNALLGRLSESIALELQPALTHVLEGTLVTALERMIAKLDQLTVEIDEQQRAGIGEMALRFSELLSEGFREEFDALSRSLRMAATWHERVHEDLGKLLTDTQRLSEGHTTMLRRTLSVSEAVRNNAESLARAERSLELAADRVQNAATTMTHALEESSSVVAGRLRTASDELSEQLGQLTSTLDKQMEQSSEHLARRIQSISLMLQRVASDIDTLSRTAIRTGRPIRS